MSLTEEVFQESRVWLKLSAPANISDMRVTADTSQESRGWLKEAA